MGNRSIVEQHYQDIRDKAWDRMGEIFSSGVITELPGAGTMRGIQPFIEWNKVFERAVPDEHLEVRTIVEQGNIVIAEGVYSGTHTGPLATPDGTEIPATGKRISIPYADVFEVENGKVVSHRLYFDQMTLMTQLGVVPVPATATA